MKKILLLFSLLLITGSLLMAQTVLISGTVVSSEDGLPLPGVTVKVPGTTIATITGNNGAYSLQVPSNATSLEYSFIGMQSQVIIISGRTKIDVTMEPDLVEVEQVVVVGYGTAKKIGTVVGSLTQVSAEKIEDKPVANVFDALQGKVAGLQVYTSSGEPSQISSIRLHGAGSLTGSTDPLYVLDGIPIDKGTMISLNQNDFESVTVLKDASATSIYGTRAANGVIYITTKKGALGTKGVAKVNVQYSSTSIADLTYFDSFFNTEEYFDFYVGLGAYTEAGRESILAAYPNDTKWYKFYYKDSAPTFQGDVSFSGGNDKTSYYISGSYFNAEGLADRSSFNRYTLRTNVNSKVNDWLTIGINLHGDQDEKSTNAYATNNLNGGLCMLLQPFLSPYDENGEEYPVYITTSMLNPAYLAAKLPAVSVNTQFNGSGYIQINPVKGLVFRTQAGMDAYDWTKTSIRYPSYVKNEYNGTIKEEYSRGVTKTITNTLEYKFNIATIHKFTALVGHEFVDNDYKYFSAYGAGLTDDRLLDLENTTQTSKAVTTDKSEYAFLSYFARLDYSLFDKYNVDFSVRQDASSRFGKNNRIGNFWATGAMWDVKKEDFLRSVDFISNLKVKFSVGTSGNSATGNYDHLATIGTNVYDESTGWILSSPGNSALQWETQIKTTLGFNFSLLQDRYRFNIELYNRKTSNMLIDVPYPYTSGFSKINSNVGLLRNSGVDIAIDFDVVNTHDLVITPYVNLNYNKEEVLELFQGNQYWNIPNTGVTWIVGEPVSFYSPYFAGIDPDDGYCMWYEPSSDPTQITTEETTKDFDEEGLSQSLGLPLYAPLNGGFGLSASYKGFSFNVDFAFSYHKYMLNNDRYFIENPTLFTGYNQMRTVTDYWQNPGDVTRFPNEDSYFTMFDSRLIEDASFLRMKNIALSYNIPQAWLDKTKFFSGAKIYMSARNLLTFTKYTGPDPEVDSNIGMGTNPNTKQLSIGAEITF